MGIVTSDGLVTPLRESGAGELTLIGNDTAFPDTGAGPTSTTSLTRAAERMFSLNQWLHHTAMPYRLNLQETRSLRNMLHQLLEA